MDMKATCRALRDHFRQSFTAHPHETGETYGEHLWFTLSMASRFALVSAVILIHGIFPFLMTHTASRKIEKIYGVIKGRAAKAPRAPADAAYLDYSV